jgi:signal transduction histidine kinase
MMLLALRIITYAALLSGTAFCAIRFGAEFLASTGGSPTASASSTMAWLGGFLGCAVTLGLRLSWDVGQFLGNRAETCILQGDPPPVLPEELTQVDPLIRQRKPLAAVNLLRDYLQAHPDALHVQYRIAEIYAEDIRNPLAAALEYEALLQRKLDPEKRGWTAIRLARLYRQLREFDKADALLRQVTREQAKTEAAGKAGKLLAEWK